jgi:hypothetical protein
LNRQREGRRAIGYQVGLRETVTGLSVSERRQRNEKQKALNPMEHVDFTSCVKRFASATLERARLVTYAA